VCIYKSVSVLQKIHHETGSKKPRQSIKKSAVTEYVKCYRVFCFRLFVCVLCRSLACFQSKKRVLQKERAASNRIAGRAPVNEKTVKISREKNRAEFACFRSCTWFPE
jgi:hypothetical protein